MRQFQRTLLLNKTSWLDRHSTLASGSVVESTSRCLNGLSEMVRRREEAILNILTVEQRIRFLAWARRRASAITHVARKNVALNAQGVKLEETTSQHNAVHLYLLDDRLREVANKLPFVPSLVPQDRVKKLSRRPMFESLSSQTASMSKNDSAEHISPSMSNSKLEEMIQGKDMEKVQITPEAAWATAATLVAEVLGPIGIALQQQPIGGVVPNGSNMQIHPVAAAPVHSAPVPPQYPALGEHNAPVAHYAPLVPTISVSTPFTGATAPNASGHQQFSSGHKREISLLNSPLPNAHEDMFMNVFPGHFRAESKGQVQADHFLLQLAEDDDWAIGGFDIEMDAP